MSDTLLLENAEEVSAETEMPEEESQFSSLDFKKNEFINSVLSEYYLTYEKTLDTKDYVPEKTQRYIDKYICKNLKAKFKEIDKVYRKYKRELKRKRKTCENTK